ncbi:MAG: hypothetical protein HQ475_02320 [SAR202 cluster bacterium]|nr:hypothetical protein [SAR202 cluster bacterium]
MTIKLKLLLLVLPSLIAVAATACGGSNTEVFLSAVVSGVVDEANVNQDGGKSETFSININGGRQLYVHLSLPEGNITGIWNADAGEYIYEVSPGIVTGTGLYIFAESGLHQFFIRSTNPKILSPFTFKIWES